SPPSTRWTPSTTLADRYCPLRDHGRNGHQEKRDPRRSEALYLFVFTQCPTENRFALFLELL
ncbi:hypothetical protein P9273_31945, partial [Mesorhizobium sp. WSM4935]|uniref:hypothetical protein n=1 Tax=Mesorhizobium sp. WSM4935 TaxID=3038547 RepID=UPI003FA5BF05|nr:hypothetical protein [Mesorhizobium sp. WSM4935]